VTVHGRRGDTAVDTDEHPRPDTSLESLGQLRPVMLAQDPESTVTAGERPERWGLGLPGHDGGVRGGEGTPPAGPVAVVGSGRGWPRGHGHRSGASDR
jgi:hypothetical protein